MISQDPMLEEASDDNDQESTTPPFKVATKKECWNLAQTNALLAYLADNFHSYSKGIKINFHQKAAAFLGQGRTAGQVKNKIDRLIKQYEEIKNNQNTTGEGRKDWIHYQKLDEMFGCRDNVNPELLVSGTGEEKYREDDTLDKVKKQTKKRKLDDDDDGFNETLKESIITMGIYLLICRVLTTTNDFYL